MIEALHLDGGAAPIAVLLEGPALVLRRQGEADRHAPLRTLRRVTVRGTRVHWRAEALIGCLHAGVPVVFLDGCGQAVGALVPSRPPAQRADFAAALDLAAGQPGFLGRLEDFCRAAEHAAAARAAGALGLRGRDGAAPRPRELLGALRDRATEPAGFDLVWEELQSLGAAVAAAALARRHVGPQFLARRAGCFPLHERLGRALALEAWPAAVPIALGVRRGDNALPPATRSALVRAFEGSGPDGHCARVLQRLAATLASELG